MGSTCHGPALRVRGRLQRRDGGEHIIPCASGNYVDAAGSGAAADCIDCAIGKYNDVSGGNHETDCIHCIAGKSKYNDGPMWLIAINLRSVLVAYRRSTLRPLDTRSVTTVRLASINSRSMDKYNAMIVFHADTSCFFSALCFFLPSLLFCSAVSSSSICSTAAAAQVPAQPLTGPHLTPRLAPTLLSRAAGRASLRSCGSPRSRVTLVLPARLCQYKQSLSKHHSKMREKGEQTAQKWSEAT